MKALSILVLLFSQVSFANPAIDAAMSFFKKNSQKFENQKTIGVIDYSKHSLEKRFHLVNVETGEIKSFRVSHGMGSDPQNTGYATEFSTQLNSFKSMLGAFKTGSFYYGRSGTTLRLIGLSETNSTALVRGHTIHGAQWVNESHVGRSFGQFAVNQAQATFIMKSLGTGALVYSWAHQIQ